MSPYYSEDKIHMGAFIIGLHFYRSVRKNVADLEHDPAQCCAQSVRLLLQRMSHGKVWYYFPPGKP